MMISIDEEVLGGGASGWGSQDNPKPRPYADNPPPKTIKGAPTKMIDSSLKGANACSQEDVQ